MIKGDMNMNNLTCVGVKELNDSEKAELEKVGFIIEPFLVDMVDSTKVLAYIVYVGE